MSRNMYNSRSSSSKRRRSRSYDRDKRKLRKDSASLTISKVSDFDFSFEHYKRDLNKIILYSSETNTVANNLDDFWVFLKKYEATLKKAGKPIVDYRSEEKIETNDIGAPIKFSKYHCINFTTKIKYVDTVCDDRRRKLDTKLFDVLLNIVSIYLDFKNKEKFEKLKKLRQAQRDLPVAKYRLVYFVINLCLRSIFIQ